MPGIEKTHLRLQGLTLALTFIIAAAAILAGSAVLGAVALSAGLLASALLESSFAAALKPQLQPARARARRTRRARRES
jgi:hypothetical protein